MPDLATHIHSQAPDFSPTARSQCAVRNAFKLLQIQSPARESRRHRSLSSSVNTDSVDWCLVTYSSSQFHHHGAGVGTWSLCRPFPGNCADRRVPRQAGRIGSLSPIDMTAEQLGELQALSPAWTALSSNQRARPFVGVASNPAGCNYGSRWTSGQNRGRQLAVWEVSCWLKVLGVILVDSHRQSRFWCASRSTSRPCCGKPVNASPPHPALHRVLRG